ncbi:dicarboxylate/amino acid:cation symporter [Hephaestia sp. GCM10023244]|uniref:dicarboxylate/amino acid:cation symporter n=1 Tax=unclassified Hephaestia TaxID=2631281 RepID=UPI00207782CE|nr:cation:dicarboxylase symporter family transporter [Hephaestia sp. MAHUQ-44]MCM8729751.1 dicarboxylate/amino acid:cation symporter [Hephaestia sp. MAHUQ-44]
MSKTTRILLALALGLAAGIGLAALAPDWVSRVTQIAQPIGTAWLNGLQMTIVPLVVALIVTGIAASAEAARAGRLTARALVTFVALLWAASALAALVTPALLDAFPLPASAKAGLTAALAHAGPVGEIAPFSQFIETLVPTNVVTAAANNAFLPLIVFALVFGFALTRLPAEQRERMTGFFQIIADAMVVVINWVLWLGPIGVFALALVFGAKAGTSAIGVLVHYVAIVSAVGIVVWLLAFPLGAIGGRIRFGRFVRATGPAHAVAISTQSSLASLPAMLRATDDLGVPVAKSGIVLPLAVAIFRVTGPPMNLAVAIYVAHLYGVPLGPAQIAAGIAVAAVTTMGAVGLPGQVSYISSIAPICIAMGSPIAALGLLVAVETLPDLVRTVGNVAMDIAVTATVGRRKPGDGAETVPVAEP